MRANFSKSGLIIGLGMLSLMLMGAGSCTRELTAHCDKYVNPAMKRECVKFCTTLAQLEGQPKKAKKDAVSACRLGQIGFLKTESVKDVERACVEIYGSADRLLQACLDGVSAEAIRTSKESAADREGGIETGNIYGLPDLPEDLGGQGQPTPDRE